MVGLPKNGLMNSLVAKTDFLTERTLVLGCEMDLSLIDSDCKNWNIIKLSSMNVNPKKKKNSLK